MTSRRLTCRFTVFVAFWVSIALVALAQMGRASAQDSTVATVRAHGLRVVAKAYGDEWRGLRAFNWSPGTAVALLVHHPQGGIIDMDEDASELKVLKDDKGTNLLAGAGFGDSGFEFTDTAEDSKALLTHVKGPGVPAKGATEITAQGTIVLLAATAQEKVENKDTALKVGTKVKGGPVQYEISKAGKPEWGDGQLEVTLKATADDSAIKSIEFFDAAGKELEVQDGGKSTMRMMGDVTIERSYLFKIKAASATIRVTYWKDMQKVAVPFDVTTGLGL